MVLKNEKHRKIVNGIIKLIIFLSVLSICLGILSDILKRKYAYEKNIDFFNQEEDFDVLFFGSSHMLNAVYPTKLWRDYGIVSYNMGNGGEKVAASYYNMLLALEHTKPKVVVIDTFTLFEEGKYHKDNKDFSHATFDAYPISKTKYLAIKDIFGEEKMLDNMFEYLWNFSIYHARWSNLERKDIIKENSHQKGAESVVSVEAPIKTNEFAKIGIYDGEGTENTPYLKKIIDHCKENDIKVLVTYLPYPASDVAMSISKRVQVMCDEYDVDYINFLELDLVNYDTDCYDEASHLNPSGARKVTDYLGDYLIERYNISDKRRNEAYSFWNEDYSKYIDLKIKCFDEHSKNLNDYLMLLYEENDISYDIKISSRKVIEEESVLYKLLENINNKYEIDDNAFETEPTKTIKITTWDKRNGDEIDTVWF